jgi:hypothetical protein
MKKRLESTIGKRTLAIGKKGSASGSLRITGEAFTGEIRE